VPVRWDDKGSAVAAAISAEGKEEYYIDNDHKGLELLDLLQEEVQVNGLVREVDGKKVITVKIYM
jgi:hypothetical protein